MKFILQMAFRNMWRHKLRSIVSITAVVIALIIGIFYRAILLGYSESTFDNYIQLESGHVRLIDSEYARRERVLSLYYPVDGFQREGVLEMISALEAEDEIRGALPRIKFAASYARKDDMKHLMGWGVDIERERIFTDFHQELSTGRMPEKGRNEIAVGSGVLKELGMEVGEKITLLYSTSYGSLQGRTFDITGSINMGLAYFDDNVFLLSLEQVQNMLEMPDQATELILFASGRNNSGPVSARVSELLSSKGALDRYELIEWQDAGGIIQWLLTYQKMIFLVLAFIVLLASIVIVNTMAMIVKERTKEIGTLGALGLQKKDIMLLITVEGAALGFTGGLLGMIIGAFLTGITSRTGINFGEVMDAMGDTMLIDPVVYPSFSVGNLVTAFIIAVVITTLACIVPARRAAEIEPSEAMKDK